MAGPAFSGGRDTREPAFLHREMASRLPQALHVVFPEAAHDLLRFRTRAVLEIERAAVRGGLQEAEQVSAAVATPDQRRLEAPGPRSHPGEPVRAFLCGRIRSPWAGACEVSLLLDSNSCEGHRLKFR